MITDNFAIKQRLLETKIRDHAPLVEVSGLEVCHTLRRRNRGWKLDWFYVLHELFCSKVKYSVFTVKIDTLFYRWKILCFVAGRNTVLLLSYSCTSKLKKKWFRSLLILNDVTFWWRVSYVEACDPWDDWF